MIMWRVTAVYSHHVKYPTVTWRSKWKIKDNKIQHPWQRWQRMLSRILSHLQVARRIKPQGNVQCGVLGASLCCQPMWWWRIGWWNRKAVHRCKKGCQAEVWEGGLGGKGREAWVQGRSQAWDVIGIQQTQNHSVCYWWPAVVSVPCQSE